MDVLEAQDMAERTKAGKRGSATGRADDREWRLFSTRSLYIEIRIPRGLSYEVFSPPTLPGWDSMPATVSGAFGERWCLERRSVILLVPSVVTRLDRNVLINPAHPEFSAVAASLHQPVFWDRRLFGA